METYNNEGELQLIPPCKEYHIITTPNKVKVKLPNKIDWIYGFNGGRLLTPANGCELKNS